MKHKNESSRRKGLPVTLAGMGLFFAAHVNGAETFNYFSRSSSIGENNVWVVQEFGEGPVILDMHVRRWNSGTGKWDSCGDNGCNDDNESRLTFGTPIYSPVDGKVRSCWRNAPDNPSPGTKLDGVQGKDDISSNDTIPGAGNHVNIETPEGHLILIAHFKSASIPAHLCPNNDVYVDDFTKAPGSTTPAVYLIPEADRPSLKKGDLIGYAGNSGNSSGPHIHIRFTSVTGPNSHDVVNILPFTLKHIWGHAYDVDDNATAGGWYRFIGHELKGDPNDEDRCKTYTDDATSCNYTMLHPSPFLHRVSANAGEVTQSEPVFLDNNLSVTAVMDADQKLRLISWRLNDISTIQRLKTLEDEAVKDMKVVRVSDTRFLVAAKLPNDQLRLKLYSVDDNGFISLNDTADAGAVNELSLSRISSRNDKFVTSVITASNQLKSIVWDVVPNGSQYSIVRLGDATGPSGSTISNANAEHFNGFYTAMRDGVGTLQVSAWTLSDDGMSVSLASKRPLGKVLPGTLAITGISGGAIVAAKDEQSELRMYSLSSSNAGILTVREQSANAGTISEVAILNPGLAQNNVATIVRDNDGKVRLIGWTANADGTLLRRDGSSVGSAAQFIGAASYTRSYTGKLPRDMILLSYRASNGDMTLQTWDTNLNEP